MTFQTHDIVYEREERKERAGSSLFFLFMDRSKLYKSKRWKKMRAAVLRRDGYMCQMSKRYGKHKEAQTVHHIFPVERYPELAFEPWNLISLTNEEHNRMHDRATHEMTEYGKELLRRTARAKGMEIPERYKH